MCEWNAWNTGDRWQTKSQTALGKGRWKDQRQHSKNCVQQSETGGDTREAWQKIELPTSSRIRWTVRWSGHKQFVLIRFQTQVLKQMHQLETNNNTRDKHEGNEVAESTMAESKLQLTSVWNMEMVIHDWKSIFYNNILLINTIVTRLDNKSLQCGN